GCDGRPPGGQGPAAAEWAGRVGAGEPGRKGRQRRRRQLYRPGRVRIDGREHHPEHRKQEEAAEQDQDHVGSHRRRRNPAVRDDDQLFRTRPACLHRAHTWLLEARTNRRENSAPISTSTSEMAVPYPSWWNTNASW